MGIQAGIDEQTREAQSAQMIAQVNSQNWQVESLNNQQDILEMQGKAESLNRIDNYNDTMEMAMVMGAASGRVFGSGSMQAIFDHSAENYRFEEMWNVNNDIITNAALEADKTNIYSAGYNTLRFGATTTGINRQNSQIGQEMQSIQTGMQMDQIQQTFNRSVTQSYQAIGTAAAGAARAYGTKGLMDSTRIPTYATVYPQDNGWLY